jgi:hypothetical protein
MEPDESTLEPNPNNEAPITEATAEVPAKALVEQEAEQQEEPGLEHDEE